MPARTMPAHTMSADTTDSTQEANDRGPASYRSVMGAIPKGVTVLTAGRGDRVHGMTATAVMSVSLDPPQVLVCVAKTSRMAVLLRHEGGFTVNVLGRRHDGLSDRFAGRTSDHTPDPAFRPWDVGEPRIGDRLDDAIAAVGCILERVHDGGSHWIVLARVASVHHPAPTDQPLVHHRGRYTTVAHT